MKSHDSSESPDNMGATIVDREGVAWPGGHLELCVAMGGGGAEGAEWDTKHRGHLCFRQSEGE